MLMSVKLKFGARLEPAYMTLDGAISRRPQVGIGGGCMAASGDENSIIVRRSWYCVYMYCLPLIQMSYKCVGGLGDRGLERMGHGRVDPQQCQGNCVMRFRI